MEGYFVHLRCWSRTAVCRCRVVGILDHWGMTLFFFGFRDFWSMSVGEGAGWDWDGIRDGIFKGGGEKGFDW